MTVLSLRFKTLGPTCFSLAVLYDRTAVRSPGRRNNNIMPGRVNTSLVGEHDRGIRGIVRPVDLDVREQMFIGPISGDGRAGELNARCDNAR